MSLVSDDDIFVSTSQLPPSSPQLPPSSSQLSSSSDILTSSPHAPSPAVSTLHPSQPVQEGVTEEDWATFPWLDYFPEHVRSDGDRSAWWWKYGFKLRDCRITTKPKARSKFICVLCHRKAHKGKAYNVSKFTFDASGAGNIKSHLGGRHKLRVGLFFFLLMSD